MDSGDSQGLQPVRQSATRITSRLALRLLAFFAAFWIPLPADAADLQSQRLRVIIETDAGGDPDDEQSLVRFLLYVNEWDVEGIIANRATVRTGENLNTERTGLGIVRRLISAYGECFPHLKQHDPRYPSPEQLLSRTVSGYEDSEDGVNLIFAAAESSDPRPIWFCNWGTIDGCAESSLRRALDQVLLHKGVEVYAKFKSRFLLSSSNEFGNHVSMDPPFTLFVDTFRPELERRRWYHRFSALTATAGGFDIQRDMLTGHGPLGSLYPTNTTHPQKEGDSMTFLYLVPTGMNDPRQPSWGSWAGRYGRNPDLPKADYYWANVEDQWQGATHRENTLARWAVDLQNDFRARLDWCVQPVSEANHPPSVMVNRNSESTIAHLKTAPGKVSLTAAGSSDPDGNDLDYEWSVYPEAGTYRGPISLAGDHNQEVTVNVPADAMQSTIHVILAVRDRGDPPLARYARVILQCESP